MQRRTADFLVGLLAVAVAAAWCWGVVATVPDLGDGTRPGPRAFPLGLGVLLGVLGAIVSAQGLLAPGPEGREAPDPAGEEDPPGRSEPWAVCVTVGLLLAYAGLLHLLGFVIATAATVALAVGPVLGDWRPRLLLGFSLGFTAAVYLVFGKLLGVYLPVGTLANLAF